MSFILDALKKSESDRQRQNAPDIADIPTGTSTKSTPRWLLLLIGLLVVNLVVLTVVLIYPMGVTEPEPAVAAPEPVAATVTRTAPPARSEPKVVQNSPPRSLTSETVSSDSRPKEPEAEFVKPEPVVPRRVPTTETHLTFNDLRASGNLTMPDMNIDIHVYSEKPADRFVFINMNQYRENATLTEGPLLREITTEGVILEYAGAVFLLPKE